jgi:hypothetical protein
VELLEPRVHPAFPEHDRNTLDRLGPFLHALRVDA